MLVLVVVSSNAMGAHGEASRDHPLHAITSGYRASEEPGLSPSVVGRRQRVGLVTNIYGVLL